MGFSVKIKEDVFVASARRCCVCKEFKGRNIEVHHIIHKNQGGEDSFENAIPLCFDCHANAGHYNPRHPKGAKFSPKELRKHRDNWYELVKDGKINSNSSDITQQFILTNSFEVAFEIANGDFKNFPINNIKLLNNSLVEYLKDIQNNFKGNDNFTNYYKSLSHYKTVVSETQEVKNKWGYSHWERTPSNSELEELFFKSEYVVNYMLRNGSDSSEICRAYFNEGGCADGNYETFDFRNIKIAFLSLINTSDKPKYIMSLSEITFGDDGFIPLNNESGKSSINEINSLLLEPGKCLLIPYCILLMDMNNIVEAKDEFLFQDIDTGQAQDIRKVSLKGKNLTIGPRHFIKSIQFEDEGIKEDYAIKDFDPENLLLISRFWECGSCPHLYAKRKGNDSWEYIGEIFYNNPDFTQTYKIDSELFDSFKIIELENEITEIEHIYLDDKEIYSSVILKKNDEIMINVNSAKSLIIKGSYRLIEGEKYVNDNNMKSQKVIYKLADINTKTKCQQCI